MKTILCLSMVLVGTLVCPTTAVSQEPAAGAAAPVTEPAATVSEPDAAAPVTEPPAAEPPAAEPPAAEPAVTELPATEPPVVAPARGDGLEVRFAFSGASWPGVLEWFAEQADLSLQLDQVPAGSFTFSDPTRGYTVPEALDVINLSLMKRGYALVRRGRLLQIIDLEAENADKLISEIAELVRPEELEERGKSDIVSCVFPLGSMTPDAAKVELALMVGPWGRVIVLDSARQVKVTETASKLIAIRDLLKSAATADSNVVELVLKYRGADELLEVARPLLGLEPDTNANEEIRIAVGLYGDRIYAAGLPGKTGLLEKIIESADQPLTTTGSESGAEPSTPVFRTHSVNSADSTTAFDVLQTLLAGTPDARIAIDPKTKAIIAWARPETHELIDQSIVEMEGSGQSFKVVDLKRLDPAQALLTINKFFGVTDGGSEGPIVDGDPATGKLWIRGSDEQIKLVENLLRELEGSDALGGLGEKVRLLPYSGRAAEEALNQVQSLWPVTGRPNRIRSFAPAQGSGGSGSGGIPERRLPREPDARSAPPADRHSPGSEAKSDSQPQYRFVSDQDNEITVESASDQDQPNADDLDANPAGADAGSSVRLNMGGADIIVQLTPGGLLIASEDTEALDAFQDLYESLASPSAMQSDLPTIYWLKYIEADIAAELISSVLGGGESTLSSAVDTVTSGLGGGMLGFLGMGGGGGGGSDSTAKSVLTSTGSVNIVSDKRLNALIVQANPVDLQVIEMILEKIDRQESPEDVETVAKPALIPVIYQDAKDVAEVVKSVFGDRIQGAQSSSGRGGGGGGPPGGQPSPQDFINALRGAAGGRGGRGEAPTSEPAKISIAVDVKSNSLVVIATPQDFEKVRALVEQLDYSSQPSEEVVVPYVLPGTVNPEVMKLALESILGTQTRSTSDSSSSSSGSPSGTPQPSGAADQTAAEIQRRIEAFRAMSGIRPGGDGPGGSPFGGFRGFPGGPFGGSPFGGGSISGRGGDGRGGDGRGGDGRGDRGR
jgi:type II secretory pathway component GspD/PulD (secretin)